MNFRALKLHHRLNIPLNLSLFVIVTTILILLHMTSSRQVAEMSDANVTRLQELSNSNIMLLDDQLEANSRQLRKISAGTMAHFDEFQTNAARDLLQASHRPLEKAFNTGDKRAVKVWLKRLGNVDGIEEISILNDRGNVSFSSENEFLDRQTSEDVMQKLGAGEDNFRRWTDAGMETYVSQKIQRKCVRCHVHKSWTDRIGETAGYFYLRVSTDTFQEVKREFNAFMTKQLEENSAVLSKLVGESEEKVSDLKKENMSRLARIRQSSIKMFGSALFGIILFSTIIMFLLVKLIVSKPIAGISKFLIEYAGNVADASGQVDMISMSLKNGVSAQISSIGETSSSLEEMSSTTKLNAETAENANNLMKDTSKVVVQTNDTMNALTTSMTDISKASDETQKVIKTIDEIAFQTNLLALNAAVEAARAGESGAGFAVVAEEVRNLALRSASAAKSTAELIEGTVEKIKDGSDLIVKTNEAFSQVTESALKVGQMIGEIAAASTIQTQEIGHVNTSVTDMDMVTQQNAANAEASASASEKLTDQAAQLKDMVEDLLVLVEGGISKR